MPPVQTIAAILGTRPEVIKLAPVATALRRRGCTLQVCSTGQQSELIEQACAALSFSPDVDLKLMLPGQTPCQFVARALSALDAWLCENSPALVLVQGDTATAFCGALAAFYRQIPVAHVEAGLRTGDLASPFPEEGQRAMVARIAAMHFAPTLAARAALEREGIAPTTIHVTGNTAIDALLAMRDKLRTEGTHQELRELFVTVGKVPVVLLTAHRRESFAGGLAQVFAAVRQLASELPHVHFVFPVHPNPSVRNAVRAAWGDVRLSNLHQIEPLGYAQFVALLDRCTLVLTDSGGIQEEAPSLGKPVLVLRDSTERPEAVLAGTARLVGTDPERIISETRRLLSDPAEYARMVAVENPFGDGRAAERIAERCLAFLDRA
jgi:UDP-N-acetylglucosamine 2-epimerase (non-hydrolysing)